VIIWPNRWQRNPAGQSRGRHSRHAQVPPADREQQILDVAVQEFGERGYAHASMAAIAQRAGISKRLIYEYFGSKVVSGR
jgi:AcrR family transcriptional regulator